ncbi:MAG: (d)CMP kinase [Alphaproteobacteria bacterium]|jgi:cytidylate kinase|nr:(d)CMP kinase [Alphaproteobacteria bacterium]NCW30057.1 (d)CMP kinase [Alphaproteobacteria bacterium]NDA18078.1 (d)CMP kinase [Alphaproteobacteria bacterium]NDG36340.1 (d)CMP kinase [Alphaproteobacteria bacterium]
MIIAIDGSAASGKGTLAKRLAADLGFDYLDTGALYRAVALSLLKAGADGDDINEKQAVRLSASLDLELTQSPEIRNDRIASLASQVAALGPVRAELLTLQRAFAATPPHGNGAVLDGRDIGTIVLPNADLKFFIDADIDIRAERRTKELLQAGQSVMFRDVLAEMQARDDRDRTRSVAPLRAADDAITIDTSSMDAAAVLALALSHIDRAFPSKR